MKAVYPCILTWNEADRVYYVNFPDLGGTDTECGQTFGDDLYDALEMAEDWLNLTLCDYVRDHNGNNPPVPTEIHALKMNDGDIAVLIRADTQKYEAELTRQRWEKVYRNCGRKEPEAV